MACEIRAGLRTCLSVATMLLALMARSSFASDPVVTQPTNPIQTAGASTTQQAADFSASLTGNWFGYRQMLQEKGIAIDVELTEDVTKNLRGGLDTAGRRWRRLIEPTATLDTKPLLGISDGTVFVDFQNADGPNASDKLVGDAQGIDGLDGVPGTPHQNRTQLAQLWYQQTAFDGALRIKIGKVDANSEFDRSTIALEFLNQSTGSSATLFTMPTYPDPAMAVNVFVKPNKNLQMSFGVFDGSLANGMRTGSRGPRTFYHAFEDLYLIGEIDQSWTLGQHNLTGRLVAGGWYSTNRFVRFDRETVDGTAGAYAILEQSIFRPNPDDEQDGRGISAFLMYGYADPAILMLDHNFGAGITWTGLIPARPDDIMGIGVQSVHFSGDFHPVNDFETSYETFYRLQLRPWLFIKPDLQYVVHPGGRGLADALAATVRFDVHF